MPIKVPSDQTVVLKGLKSYTDERLLNQFVDLLECRTSLPCRPATDPKNQGEKQAFLNYRTSTDARAALSKIANLSASSRFPADRLPDIMKEGSFRCYLKSEGPNKSFQPSLSQQGGFDSDYSTDYSSEDEDERLVDFLVDQLKAAPDGGIQGSQVGNIVAKRAAWRREVDDAGGVKMWCEDNAGKVKFNSQTGRVVLDIADTSLSTGDYVKFARETHRVDRGQVPPWGVGTVKSVNVNVCVVDFPEQMGWRGSVKHLIKASKQDSELKEAFTPADDYFDRHAFVRKKEANVFEFLGTPKPGSGTEYGFVRGKRELKDTAYFEIEIVKDPKEADLGIALGLCGDSIVAGHMLGWQPGNIGYHSDDGNLFFGTGTGASYGPKAKVGDRMGCGVIEGRLSKSCYFTFNGNVIGRILLSTKTDDETSFQLYPAVTSCFGSVVKMNMKATPPPNATEVGCVLTTSKWQAKYNDSSRTWKVVSRQGPPRDSGEVPVTFAGFEDVVWVAPQRLRKALGNEAGMEDHNMATLELACLMADDGDIIKVNPGVGVHHLHRKVVIRKKISIMESSTGPKPVISKDGDFVFEIRSEVSLKNLCIKSFGGSAQDGFDSGGTAGVVLVSGKLQMSECEVISTTGSGVAVSRRAASQTLLDISDCSIGPCGRHGLILNGSDKHRVSKLRISDSKRIGIATNDTIKDITIDDCTISKCGQAMKIIDPNAIHVKKTKMIACVGLGASVEVFASSRRPGTFGISKEVSFEDCLIEGSPKGIEAEGPMLTVNWGESNSIVDCKVAVSAVLGAKVTMPASPPRPSMGSDRRTMNSKPENDMPPSIQYHSDKQNSSEGFGEVGSEEDNFARYFRLLQHTATQVLLSVFVAAYKKKSGKAWTPDCGKELHKALPRSSMLSKDARALLASGDTDTWDITLLSALLLFDPGYLKGKPEESLCEAIRKHRNDLNHTPPTFKCNSCSGKCSCGLGQPIMPKAEFGSKWEALASVISKLTSNLLSKEEHQAFASQVAEMLTHKYRVSEDREMRDLFNSELRNVSDRIGKIEESAVTKSFLGKAIENLQNLFRGNGTVDKDKLPQKVVLSNDKTYVLVKKAGAGGMGTVFVAVAQDTNEQVALKICDGGDQRRAEREAEVLRRLTKIDNHENVVRFIESAIHNSHFVIIMELVKGISLEEWLDVRGRESCTWQESKDIVLGIVAGMSEVHKIEISHRDLKPGNIMFDEASGKIVIVDFGLSKQSNANQTMTVAGGAGFGTKPYMSPEQVDAEFGEVYLPSDIWAIGIIWHEILSGITPFEPIVGGDSRAWAAASTQDERATLKITNHNLRHEAKLIHTICDDKRDWDRLPPGLPPTILEVISKCLEHKKSMRYQTATELRDHVVDVFAGLDGTKVEVSPQVESGAKPFAQWSVDEVCQLLNKCGFSEQATLCREEGVDGKTWASLSPEELKSDLGLSGLKLKRFQAEVAELAK